jgi:GHMP kinase, N-terminal domain protein
MKKLLSLPPNVVGSFHDITGLSRTEYFCTSDPVNQKLGSGGGTVWLLQEAFTAENSIQDFSGWLSQEKRILLHAGGQSRRLAAYAPSGKVLTPIPVFRWARGQRVDQSLLDMQLPLYEMIMQKAPQSLHTLIASGDVFLRATQPLQTIPEADVVCYGLWATPEQISHHGVFMMNRENPTALDFMLQKPSTEKQAELMQTHFALMDIGVWLLSDKAVEVLRKKCVGKDANINTYDLYSEFGCALGIHPSKPDAELESLNVAILPLPGGEFYHFGTAPELLTSTISLQNLVKDQRFIIQKGVKRQTSVFTQNCLLENRPTKKNEYIWVENSKLSAGWDLSRHNIVTGVPQNNWQISLKDGQCIDVVPIGEKAYALRVYGYNDPSRGALDNEDTIYLGQPFKEWAAARHLPLREFGIQDDIQSAQLFPVSESLEELEELLHFILTGEGEVELFLHSARLSADELSVHANLYRLFKQRREIQLQNCQTMAYNWRRSVFYQVNLKDMAQKYADAQLPLPSLLSVEDPLMVRMHDAMFRSETLRHLGQTEGAELFSNQAFGLLREGLTGEALRCKVAPSRTTCDDQIVWGRSSARIDLAGGWTDTPPYSLMEGGNVVNIAIEMNGQQPLQVYVKPCKEPVIICRSIDLGAMERIETYDELRQYNKVGSPFSIPKAALTLCGFLPGFGTEEYPTLRQHLEAFGCGIELTLLSAIPAGSGLGTSSILAATVLGTLSEFCGLNWDKNEIGNRTLILEQLLTTGGGWQDQYGGILGGVKLLQTQAGFLQNAVARYLPATIFTAPENRACHLLYYTGVTRTAKNILTEIVRGMFLNDTHSLSLLSEMKQHALSLSESLQMGDIERYGLLVRKTWEQNKALDAGTNPTIIEELCKRIDDYSLGYKLPGAGGGGFMYIVAKDPTAALRIREELSQHPLAPNARFIEMSISERGLQISRS